MDNGPDGIQEPDGIFFFRKLLERARSAKRPQNLTADQGESSLVGDKYEFIKSQIKVLLNVESGYRKKTDNTT